MFDFDGVIADSFDVFFQAFSSVCSDMGFHRLNSEEAMLKLFEGNALRELVKIGFPVWRLKRLARKFEPRIEEANAKIAAFDGMPELLGELAAAFPVYVVTSNASQTVSRFLDRYAVTGVRDILGADHEASKVKKIRGLRKRHPHAAAYYIGDTKGDIVEGKTAGAVTVAAAWGWHPEATLLEADPDHTVHSPEELRRLFLS